jgi:short-subunit dehydrogenase
MQGLDLLVYSSGYGAISDDLDPFIESCTTETNVVGFVSIAGFAFNYFVKQGYGQIAIISSVAALRGNAFAPAYSASKAFMSVYAEGLNLKARRLRKDIIVTDIRPGFVDTKMAQGKTFWVGAVNKVAKQIIHAIEQKKRVAYITRRWWLVAQLLKMLPYSIYRKIS